MSTYQRHAAAPALPGARESVGKVVHLPSYRRKKSLDSASLWNIIFSVLVVAVAVCVFLR